MVKQKEARSIVVSYDTWQRRLGGTQDVIGTVIRVGGEPRTVIGVMPKGFSLVPWAISVLMLAAALGAAWVPVHRVTRIDPQQALRYE